MNYTDDFEKNGREYNPLISTKNFKQSLEQNIGMLCVAIVQNKTKVLKYEGVNFS